MHPKELIAALYVLFEYIFGTVVISFIITYSDIQIYEKLSSFFFSSAKSLNFFFAILLGILVILLSTLCFCYIIKRFLISIHKKWIFLKFLDEENVYIILFYVFYFVSFMIVIFYEAQASGGNDADRYKVFFDNFNIVANFCFVGLIIFKNDKIVFDRYIERFKEIIPYMPEEK